MAETKMIRIQYYRSKNSTPARHKAVVKGLGFTRLNQIVERGQRVDSRHGEDRSASGVDFGGLVDQLSVISFQLPVLKIGKV